jgi:hypothetical protein
MTFHFVFDLVNFLVGAGAGMVVMVVVPKVYSWVSAEVAVVEAKEKSAANTVAAAVSSAANTVSKL